MRNFARAQRLSHEFGMGIKLLMIFPQLAQFTDVALLLLRMMIRDGLERTYNSATEFGIAPKRT